MTLVAMRTRDCYKAMAAARMVKTYLDWVPRAPAQGRHLAFGEDPLARKRNKQQTGTGTGRETIEVWAWVDCAQGRQGRAGRASFRGRWGACEIWQQAAPDCRLVLAGRQTRECRQASAEAAGDMALAMHVHLRTCTAVAAVIGRMEVSWQQSPCVGNQAAITTATVSISHSQPRQLGRHTYSISPLSLRG